MRNILIRFVILWCFQCLSFSALAETITEPDWAYSVKLNDSFYGIYRQYLAHHSDIAKLSAYNHHKLNKKLQPGQVLNIPIAMLKKLPAPVKVLVASGDVVSSMAPNYNTQKVSKGDVLAQGDSLKTGQYSVAKLSFADGSIVDVQQNSQIEIHASYQYAGKANYVTLLKLVKGRTEVGANPQHTTGNALQIKTPSAIAAVRGTHFRVSAQEDSTMQETLEGKVAFSASGQEVLLAQGYGSLAKKDQAPLPPISLPNAPDISELPKQVDAINGQIMFDLKPQADAVAVSAILSNDAQSTYIVNEQTTSNNRLKLDIPADGQYYLRLSAQESHGLRGPDAVHVFDVKTKVPPVAPTFGLIAPTDAAVIALAPTTFSWTAMPQAQQYLLQIARDDAFNDVVFEQVATENQLIIRQSFGQGQFYWRVKMLEYDRPLQASEIRKFSR